MDKPGTNKITAATHNAHTGMGKPVLAKNATKMPVMSAATNSTAMARLEWHTN